MAKNNNLTDFLTGVANAIRAKKGTSATINPQNFETEIASIPTGSDAFKVWKVTVPTDVTTAPSPDVGVPLVNDAWVASHYSDADLLAGYYPVSTVAGPCVGMGICGNTAYNGGHYGFLQQITNSSWSASNAFDNTRLDKASGKGRAAVYAHATGDISVSASATYPLRAGTYIVWAARINAMS